MLQQKVARETLAMGETAQPQYASAQLLTDVLFDQTYKAVFDAKNTVIGSSNLTAVGRPLALATGLFDQTTVLELVALEPSVNGAEVLESWQVRMDAPGLEKLHYHIPEGVNAENLRLLVRDAAGNWVQREFAVEGSYMIFELGYGEDAFALELLPEEEMPVVLIGVGGFALLVAVVLICRKRKKGAACEK